MSREEIHTTEKTEETVTTEREYVAPHGSEPYDPASQPPEHGTPVVVPDAPDPEPEPKPEPEPAKDE